MPERKLKDRLIRGAVGAAVGRVLLGNNAGTAIGATLGFASGGRSMRSPRSSRMRMFGGKKSRSSRRWVQKAEKSLRHPGALSRKAESRGMSTGAFACHVLKNKAQYTMQTRKEAQFYVNINKQHAC